ncbi:MAG: peptide deformylase [Candidatus Omnitrophota bacterium]
MPVKKILTVFDSEQILRTKSSPILISDPELPIIIQDIKDTLFATANGVGLAAVQIGYLKRIFALKKEFIINDLDEHSIFTKSGESILIFINPKIISEKGILHESEGCLSVPDKCVKIQRASIVKVKAFDDQGQQFYERMRGLAARAVQQEIDHLDGVLILDYDK